MLVLEVSGYRDKKKSISVQNFGWGTLGIASSREMGVWCWPKP